ncbi:hypothetical protein BH09PSE5_BH09PSE5_28920 [soil metagenome]
MSDSKSTVRQSAARLRRSISLMHRRLRAGPQGENLSAAKLSVVTHLHKAGSLTPTELAATEGVKLQSLTRLLASLEAEDWIVRNTHPTDARQSVLTLSKSGVRRLSGSADSSDSLLAGVIGKALSATERGLVTQACELLDKLAEALGSASVPAVGSAEKPASKVATKPPMKSAAKKAASKVASSASRPTAKVASKAPTKSTTKPGSKTVPSKKKVIARR